MTSRSPFFATAFAAAGVVAAPAAPAAVFTGWADGVAGDDCDGDEDGAFDWEGFAGAFSFTGDPSSTIFPSADGSGLEGCEELCRRGCRTRRSGDRTPGVIGRGLVVNADAWAPSPL